MSHLIAPLSAEGLAAIIASLGALVTALQGKRQSKKAADIAETTAAQFQPDHGTSFADKQELILDLVKSQGHQIGEIREDMTGLRKDVSALQMKEILYE
ncbi:MAG: hypothetical protein PUK59_07095 [Actinomycetaceae bacterium]|nr:hypothetical protein [Actinomycetaceae bacterium]MDY5854947.1 hypothetical protein [Arcanobacterium sp.]